VRFQQQAPVPGLQSIVECIWTVETAPGERAVEIEPVLPDGCPELIVHFGAPFERISGDGGHERQAAILFAGQLTGQLTLRPTGPFATLGVRFRPAGAAAILQMPQPPLLGTTFAVEALDSRFAQTPGAYRPIPAGTPDVERPAPARSQRRDDGC
jgi:hypothetical protein